MRESLFERLKKKELSFIDQMVTMTDILKMSSFGGPYSYYCDAFKRSPFNVHYKNLYVALCDLLEVEGDDSLELQANDFEGALETLEFTQRNLTLDSFLDYLELFETIWHYHEFKNRDIGSAQIESIVLYDCDRLGYKFVLDDNGTYRVMPKDTIAEAVALKQKDSVRKKIYKYLMIREGCTEEKRECIKSLADDVENMCKKYSSIHEYAKLKQFIQCVRHTKDSPKKEFPFYYANEEKWLDKTFEMIIGVLSFTKAKEIVAEVDELEAISR